MTAITAVERDAKALSVQTTTRPRCPFYGFVGMLGVLMDNRGNGCGLANGHRPCAMEMRHVTPSWVGCFHFNHGGNRMQIEDALDNFKIFPEELKPKDSVAWEGVNLRGWYQLILRE